MTDSEYTPARRPTSMDPTLEGSDTDIIKLDANLAEARAGADQDNLVYISAGQWEHIVDYAKSQPSLTRNYLQRYGALTAKEAEAVFEGLQARGILAKQTIQPGLAHSTLNDDDKLEWYASQVTPPPQEQGPRKKSGRIAKVAKVLGKIVPPEIKKQTEEFAHYVSRPVGRLTLKVTGVEQERQDKAQQEAYHRQSESLSQIDVRWEASRKWNLMIEDGAMHSQRIKDRVAAQEHARAAKRQASEEESGISRSGNAIVERARSPRRQEGKQAILASTESKGSSRAEHPLNPPRITDSWELGLLYMAGELNKEKKQPPAMSPASLAHKYVNYFKLYEASVKDGMEEAAARAKAEREILPLAAEHFAQMQALGLVAEGYVKIDPNDPSHDSSTTGHKVLATPEQIQNILSDYRNQGNKKP